MLYGAVSYLVMFVFCTVSFMAYDKKLFGVRDVSNLVGMIGLSFALSVFWIVTIPTIVLIASAWLLAKCISGKITNKSERKRRAGN